MYKRQVIDSDVVITGTTGGTGSQGPRGDVGNPGQMGSVGQTGSTGPQGFTGGTGASGKSVYCTGLIFIARVIPISQIILHPVPILATVANQADYNLHVRNVLQLIVDLSNTQCSEKTPTYVFFIITPAFIGQFLYFLYQWNRE